MDTDSDVDGANGSDSTDVATEADGEEGSTDEDAVIGDQDHPPEYYLARAEDVNKSRLIAEDYAPNSTLQLNRIEKQWEQ